MDNLSQFNEDLMNNLSQIYEWREKDLLSENSRKKLAESCEYLMKGYNQYGLTYYEMKCKKMRDLLSSCDFLKKNKEIKNGKSLIPENEIDRIISQNKTLINAKDWQLQPVIPDFLRIPPMFYYDTLRKPQDFKYQTIDLKKKTQNV